MINEKRNINFFDVVDNEAKAYFLGFLWSDGSVSDGNRLSLLLKEKDFAILEKFAKFLNIKVYYFKGNARVALRNKHLYDTIGSYGIVPRKTYLNLIPPNLGNLQNHFWRGVFDGDGHISNKFNVATLCGTRETIYSFKNWIETYVQTISEPYQHKSGLWYIRITGERLRKTLCILYQNSEFHLERKKLEFQAIIDKNRKSKSLRPSKQMYIYFTKGKGFYIKIKKDKVFKGYFKTEAEAIKEKRRLGYAK